MVGLRGLLDEEFVVDLATMSLGESKDDAKLVSPLRQKLTGCQKRAQPPRHPNRLRRKERGRTWVFRAFGQVAQLVEQRTENPCVASSILALTTLEGSRKLPQSPVIDKTCGIFSALSSPAARSLGFAVSCMVSRPYCPRICPRTTPAGLSSVPVAAIA